MAGISATLAWSVPVKADELATHLQAYANVHNPCLSTLRLCHRFGHGEQVAINRLPVELIFRIEDHVMNDEREHLGAASAEMLACWEGKCKPRDHIGAISAERLFVEWYGGYDCGGCGCFVSDPALECDYEVNCVAHYGSHMLTEEQLIHVDRTLEDQRPAAQELGLECEWDQRHRQRVLKWRNTTSLSRFDSYRGLLLRHFGLGIWYSDTQPRPLGPGHDIGIHAIPSASVAHLTLPASSPQDSSGCDNNRREPIALQSGYCMDVAIPSQLSQADIRRFSRAIRILKLTVTANPTHGPLMSASSSDADRWREEKENAVLDGSSAHSFKPCLRLLVSGGLDVAGWQGF